MHYSERFTIIIPVWNSGAYLDIILRHYARLGIKPFLIIDAKTNDNTYAIASQFGCQTYVVENPTKRSQHLIEPGASQVKTPWALKMDDDELPNRGLLDHIMLATPTLPPAATVGFLRFQCALRGRRLWASTVHTAEFHRQFRLFQPTYAEYTKQGHSPGFLTPVENRVPAPNDAAMVHLDWIVHTSSEREEKIARYDAHSPNSGTSWREYYLADRLDGDFQSHLEPLPVEGFNQLAKELHQRFERGNESTIRAIWSRFSRSWR
jgi:hypothetical protein